MNALRRDLPGPLRRTLARVMAETVAYGLDHREEALDYAMGFARDLDREKADRFVGMYVNDWTRDAGPEGEGGGAPLPLRGRRPRARPAGDAGVPGALSPCWPPTPRSPGAATVPGTRPASRETWTGEGAGCSGGGSRRRRCSSPGTRSRRAAPTCSGPAVVAVADLVPAALLAAGRLDAPRLAASGGAARLRFDRFPFFLGEPFEAVLALDPAATGGARSR